MSEIFLVIKIGGDNDFHDFQYALEIEKGSIGQLAMLNAMIDVAKNGITDKIRKLTEPEK